MRRASRLARAAALLAAIAVPPALAQPASDAGRATVAKVARITAKVDALDRTARTITLRGTKGGVTFAAGPEVRGFDLVRVGDLVVVRYLEAVLVDIREGGPNARERIEPGPEGGARRVTLPAEVVAKDATKRTVTLRGAKQTVELKAARGEQLKSIQVGGRVVASYTEPTAVSIELAVSRPSEPKK